MCPKDYVRYRLTGEFAIDVQEASGTLLLDVTHRRWSKEVAEAAGIPESWLPKVYESPEVCARISESAAGLTGLEGRNAGCRRRGRPGSRRGGHGHFAAGIGVGNYRHIRRGLCRNRQPTKDPKGRLHTFCHAVPGRWHVMGVTQSAGLSLRWLRGTFFAGQNYDALNGGAANVPAGSEGLEWAPYLLGERTPHLDPEVRAAFAGIGMMHTAAHFVRAVSKGVAYSLQDTFTLFADLGIPVTAIRLGGGGARGALWRKIQAGVYGASGRDSGRRRRRRVWLRADGRRGRGSLGQSRRSMCGRPSKLRSASSPTPQMWPPTRPATRIGASCIRR